MSSGILGPKCSSGHPAGHPKLLQIETPLLLLRLHKHVVDVNVVACCNVRAVQDVWL